MRMTNKILENNSLYNINNNKNLQNKLSTQMATQKKITRPSDDPVVAIRALRLRSDVSQINQFYEKNAPDAESWLKVTADALNTSTQILRSMLEQCNKGSNKDLKTEELDIIVEQLKSLRDEYYATGNVDYAGRYVFTGFRTNTSLSYTEDTTENYKITEQLNSSTAIDKVNYTDINGLKGLTQENYDPTVPGIPEQNINTDDIYRIRLSYDQLKAGELPTISKANNTTVPPTLTPIAPSAAHPITQVSATASPDPYQTVMNDPDAVVYVPETGELLLGKNVYDTEFKGLPANTELQVSYEKESWKKGDMRPQHYFPCSYTDTSDPAAPKTINYNHAKDANGNEYIPADKIRQTIEYDVGYNQKIQINTEAGDAFDLSLDRNIDDLEKALNSMKEIDAAKANLEKLLAKETEGTTRYNNIKDSLDAANKAQTKIRENMNNVFSGMITKTQGTMDKSTVAHTNNSTRSSRLDLISSRLMTQQTTFKTLQSENEDADITQIAIQLTSMNFSYQSALLATGKIMQTSLINYI